MFEKNVGQADKIVRIVVGVPPVWPSGGVGVF